MMSTVQKLGEGCMAAEYYASYRGLSSPEVSSSYAAVKKKVMDDDDDLDVEEEEQGDERNEDEENEREEEEELELGLSLGARKIGKGNVAGVAVGSGPLREYCRILTAKDFPSMLASRVSPNSSSASSSSSSFSLVERDGEAHPSADGGSHAPSQAVGWPPIRSYRMNNIFNQNKDNVSENNFNDQGKTPIGHKVHAHHKSSKKSSNNIQEIANAKDKEKKCRSHFVKVNMDGMAIGRKVDLIAHQSYETLALVLEDMFQSSSSFKTPFKNIKASMLLDGSSEFVLTYEDKDGDWMLVGDVPWGMFLSSVRRLRIMRTSDANGLAPGFHPTTA